MVENIFKYLEKNFPAFSGGIYLRFELGDPYDNGTDQRINQVIYRVTTLFEEVFNKDDMIYLYIKDFGEYDDPMFGNTTPHYLDELIDGHKYQETELYFYDEDLNDEGETIEVVIPYKVKTLIDKVSSIRYKEILTGIGHYEQGREPSIGQAVYFINTETNVIFNMYDDRGCLIISKDKDKLYPLYRKYNDWLVDYWRDDMDDFFRDYDPYENN